MKIIPKEAIERFKELETYLAGSNYSPRDIAKAYISIPASTQILQLLAFTPFPDRKILETISMLELDKFFNVKPGISVSENKQFWTKIFAPLASYLCLNERKKLKSIPYQIAMISFQIIYNGIDMKRAKKLLKKEKCDHLGSLANSLGGDVWKNSLINRINGHTEKEYVADTLGLRMVEIHLEKQELKLTDLMQKANDNENTEFAIDYKNSSYWKITQECFVPDKDKPINFPFNHIPKTIQNKWSGEQDYSKY